MTPLEGPPNRGYADWQRVENWDSGVLLSVNTPVITAATPIGPFDVSRYGYIGGFMSPGTGQVNMFLAWYLDAAETVESGFRYIQLYPAGQNQAQVRLPNLGPFVSGQFVGQGGGQYSIFANLFGTNRYHPLEFIPQQPMLINAVTMNIAAGQQQSFYPVDYYAGPVKVNVESDTIAAWTWRLQYLGGNGVWTSIDTQAFTATGTWESVITVTPSGAWRMQIINQGAAAGSFSLVATPSLTGST